MQNFTSQFGLIINIEDDDSKFNMQRPQYEIIMRIIVVLNRRKVQLMGYTT